MMKSNKVESVCVMECPGCGSRHEDDLEVLSTNDVHAIRCSDCACEFWSVLKECLGCGEESVFVWKAVPTVTVLAALMCESCGHVFTDPEYDSDQHPHIN